MTELDIALILLQIATPTGLWGWLLTQTPVVIVMGIIVWRQDSSIQNYKKDLKEQSDSHRATLDDRDKIVRELAGKALTVASLYDVRGDINSKEHEKILSINTEIRDMVFKLDPTKN